MTAVSSDLAHTDWYILIRIRTFRMVKIRLWRSLESDQTDLNVHSTAQVSFEFFLMKKIHLFRENNKCVDLSTIYTRIKLVSFNWRENLSLCFIIFYVLISIPFLT